MSCETCTELKDVIRCNTRITMGTYDAITPIIVYWEDLGTGKVTYHSMTTAADGDIDLTHSFSFRNGQTYRFWINESDASMRDMAQFTLPDGKTTLTCGLIRFIDLHQEDGDKVTGSTVEFTAA